MKYERIKFLVIAVKNSVEVYAWAPKPYHKFMAFKVNGRTSVDSISAFLVRVLGTFGLSWRLRK